MMKMRGKPFFPYAVLKDSLMACIVLVVIIVMAILFGSELGPKADPTSTTYTPRPEWYFFFLFELLRVVKPPALVFIATVGIPTVCMVLLFLLPTFVSARLVSLAVRQAYAIMLDERFPTVLSLPSHASVTLWEATAPVKLPTMRCPGPR